jgi:hypothetical protein
MPEINENVIKVRLGTENAIRIVSSSLSSTNLSGLDDVNISGDLPNNSVLVYNSSTKQWDPYIFIDGGTY